jgi:predicted double-glycine peptidase
MLLLQCLPICVDIGTNNPVYLEDPDYRGIKAPRVTGKRWWSPLLLLLVL